MKASWEDHLNSAIHYNKANGMVTLNLLIIIGFWMS